MKLLFVFLICLCRLFEPFVWNWFCAKLAFKLGVSNTKDNRMNLFFFIIACFGSFLVSDFIGELNILSFLINNSLFVIYLLYAVKVYNLSYKIICGCLSIHCIFSCFMEYVISFFIVCILNTSSLMSFGPSLIRCVSYMAVTFLSFLVFYILSRLDGYVLSALEHDRIYYTLVFVFGLDILAFCTFSCIPNESIFNIGTFISLMIEVAITCHALRMLFLDVKALRNFETELLCTKNKLEMFQFSTEKLDETSKFLHDVKHHLNAISLYLERDDIESAKEYISGVVPAMSNLQIKNFGFNRIGNLIYRKMQEARSLGIEFDFSSSLVDIKIPLYKLNSAFNNLIDNAIEGCLANTSTEHHRITFTIMVSSDSLVVSVMNDCLPTLTSVPTETTKADKENHGYGLSIVSDFVDKYHGSIFFLAEYGLFLVQLNLPASFAVLPECDENKASMDIC